MSSPYPIHSARLIIKPMDIEFAKLQLALVNTPKWKKYIGDRNLQSIEDAETYIQTKMLPQFSEKGFGNNAIILRQTNTPIGSVGIYDRPGLNGYDFGFALLPEYEKKGYALEASRCLLNAAQTLFQLKKLSAITVPENTESQRLLEKIGFTFEDTITIESEKLMRYEIHLNLKFK